MLREAGLRVMGDALPVGSCITPAEFQGDRAMKVLYPSFPQEPAKLGSLQILLSCTDCNKRITKLHNASQCERGGSVNTVQDKWNATLDSPLSQVDWEFCCTLLGKLTANCSLRIIHLKYPQQDYYSPFQLHRFRLQVEASCVCCGATACGPVDQYWSHITQTSSDMVEEQVESTPRVFVLGFIKSLQPINRKFVAVSLLIANRRV